MDSGCPFPTSTIRRMFATWLQCGSNDPFSSTPHHHFVLDHSSSVSLHPLNYKSYRGRSNMMRQKRNLKKQSNVSNGIIFYIDCTCAVKNKILMFQEMSPIKKYYFRNYKNWTRWDIQLFRVITLIITHINMQWCMVQFKEPQKGKETADIKYKYYTEWLQCRH